MKNIFFIFLYFSYILMYVYAAQNIYCTGHDACQNNIWNGEYNIFCGAANSERTCKSTTLNCGSGQDCTIKTQGSGHDAYQFSTVNAKQSNSFKLTCQASGLRDCKTITIWCPQGTGTSCECVSCPSTVTMKCVSGISCSSISNANIEYVASEQTSQSNNNNECENKTIYNNVTLYNYKNITRYNNVTRYNDVIRYNNITRYNDIIRYNNITRYNNETRYTNVIRYNDVTLYNYKNITRYIDKIRYINSTICKKNTELNKFFMMGFYINLGIILCIIIMFIFSCCNIEKD